jgi:hypothetical protein
MEKNILLILILLICTELKSQIVGEYIIIEKDQTQLTVIITDSLLEVSQTYAMVDDVIFTKGYFSSKYKISNDTIVVFKYKKPISYLKIDSLFLEVLTDDMPWAKKGTRFYRRIFYHINGRPKLMGMNWYDGKKDGYWLFFDSLGFVSGHILFDKGLVLDTLWFFNPIYNITDTIP